MRGGKKRDRAFERRLDRAEADGEFDHGELFQASVPVTGAAQLRVLQDRSFADRLQQIAPDSQLGPRQSTGAGRKRAENQVGCGDDMKSREAATNGHRQLPGRRIANALDDERDQQQQDERDDRTIGPVVRKPMRIEAIGLRHSIINE